MPTFFAPENDNYYEGLLSSLPFFVWITLVLTIVFLIFIIGRFGCKKCDATLERDETYQPSKRSNYICGMWLFGMFLLASTASTLFGNIGFMQ